MKRTVSLLTVLFCFVIWVQCVCAEPIISAETNQSTVTAGGVFTVSVKVNAENITGMQFDILYNPQTFEYQDSELTGVFDEALVSGIEAHEDGRVTLVAAFTEEQSISEKICAVDFRAIAGDGNLQIANIKLMVNKEKVSESDFDIAVRSGFHCAPFVHELIGTVDTHGTVRISIGHFNSESDIDVLISALREL